MDFAEIQSTIKSAIVSLVASVLACGAVHAVPIKAPNILFIIADQWRAQAFGFAGDPNIKTPNFDRLEKQSINFTQAVAGLPVCSPTRATLPPASVLRRTAFSSTTSRSTQTPSPCPRNSRPAAMTPAASASGTSTAMAAVLSSPPNAARDSITGKSLECTHDYNKSPYFTGYLRGGADPSGGATVIRCITPFGEFTRSHGGKEYREIRSPHYTYVRDLTGPWLLYDNEKDPLQLDNLVGNPKSAKLQAEQDTLLKHKLAEQHDAFLPGADYITKWGYKVDANGTARY